MAKPFRHYCCLDYWLGSLERIHNQNEAQLQQHQRPQCQELHQQRITFQWDQNSQRHLAPPLHIISLATLEHIQLVGQIVDRLFPGGEAVFCCC